MKLKTGRKDPAFLIVGTPRSGTTLLQRIVCEFHGVSVPPETWFWPMFAGPWLRHRNPAPDTTGFRSEFERYTSWIAARGLNLQVESIAGVLDGQCESLSGLFGAVVRALVPGASIAGEKTPPHLLWWRPLTRSLPHLKVISIVRDPRAVVASSRSVPFMPTSDALVAERWTQEQRQVLRAMDELSDERFLMVRYEDLVTDPEGTRARVARFLCVDASVELANPSRDRLFHRWEWWKERALESVSSERADAWRRELSQGQEEMILTLCGEEMRRFGYQDSAAGTRRFRKKPVLEPRTAWRVARFRRHFRKRQEWIDGLTLDHLSGWTG